jgi:hypothetical protein
VPRTTDGILRWLGLVIADHFPALTSSVADLTVVVSASVFVLLGLTLVSSLVVFLLRQRRLNNPTMHDVEMAIEPATESGCKAPPMDVDMEKENNQASAENGRELVAHGLPFPSTLLADGTFTVEYHNM